MKNNNIIIKEVKLAKYTGNQNTKSGAKNSRRDHYTSFEFELVKTTTCVIDVERNKAIDIETGEIWNLVQRNDQGIILKEELTKILTGEICALRTYEKDWDKISLLYKLTLKDRAKKIYMRYLDSLGNECAKVKKIGKKESK